MASWREQYPLSWRPSPRLVTEFQVFSRRRHVCLERICRPTVHRGCLSAVSRRHNRRDVEAENACARGFRRLCDARMFGRQVAITSTSATASSSARKILSGCPKFFRTQVICNSQSLW